ncbi:TetR/AcrR family transcriptional regulator [Ruminococcaceae bacterium OttesenSCG-928-O06]|nr:TetR/AcrR family transcriptional regulator [Ruminococcaceae bacterium OttesenSCG-928-O06]
MLPISDKETAQVLVTKRLIYEAFGAMLQEKRLSNITVSRICARAQVSRAAFYNHYPNKEVLLQEIFDRIIVLYQTKFQEIVRQGKRKTRDSYTLFCKIVWRNREFFIELDNNNMNHILADYFLQSHQELFRYYANKDAPERREYREYFIRYHANGMAALIAQWVKRDEPEPPEVMADIMLRLYHSKHYEFFVERPFPETAAP